MCVFGNNEKGNIAVPIYQNVSKMIAFVWIDEKGPQQ